MKTTKTNDGISSGAILAIGAGVAALATTTYYFFGPKGDEHRKSLKGWMIKMKGEIIERIEDVKELTEPVYRDIVDSVVATYATTTKASKEELAAFADRLKGQWKEILASTQEKKKAIARKTTKTKARLQSGTRRTQ